MAAVIRIRQSREVFHVKQLRIGESSRRFFTRVAFTDGCFDELIADRFVISVGT